MKDKRKFKCISLKELDEKCWAEFFTIDGEYVEVNNTEGRLKLTGNDAIDWYVDRECFEEVKSDNRKFKFVGDASEYRWDLKLEKGKVYDEDTIAFSDRTVGSLYDSNKDDEELEYGEYLADWEIVVDDENQFKPVPPIDPYLKWLGESISLLDSFGADSVEFKAARVVYEYYVREVKKS